MAKAAKPQAGQGTTQASKWDVLQKLTEADFRTKVIMPLLSRMGYTDVQERHGPQEFGKDIVAKQDHPMAPMYIAVVAKVGDISGQAAPSSRRLNNRLEDIRSQVDQALGIPFPNIQTKQKIHINQVFVWVTGNISNQAETNIIENVGSYDRNVRFFSATQTLQWLEQYYPAFFTFEDAYIGQYYQSAKAHLSRIDELRTIGSAADKVTTTSIFIMPHLLPVQSDINGSKRKRRGAIAEDPRISVETLLNSPNKNMLIMGDAGSGKSTILRRIALRAMERNEKDLRDNRIPVIVEFRTIDFGLAESIDRALWREFMRYQQDTVIKNSSPEIIDGKFLLLLDGLDELKDRQTVERAFEAVRNFKRRFPRTQVIMTSRIMDILNKRDSGQQAILPSFKLYRIAPLSVKQMTTFVKKWFGDNENPAAEKLIQYVSHPAGLYGLPATPECVKHGETDDNGANGLLKKDYSRNTAAIDGSTSPTGRLIHTASGTRGGRGVPRTKRSGWAA